MVIRFINSSEFLELYTYVPIKVFLFSIVASVALLEDTQILVLHKMIKQTNFH